MITKFKRVLQTSCNTYNMYIRNEIEYGDLTEFLSNIEIVSSDTCMNVHFA